MNDSSRRRRALRRAVTAAAISSTAALLGLAGSAAPKAAQHEPTARQQYKNIRVLQDLPANQLIPVMHNWSLSLGVGCDFCHVVETDSAGKHVGFDKDTKPTKEMARKMVRMSMDINAHYKIVDKAVRCYTCHHGHAEPVSEPPAPTGTGR